jgi:hypothetical protein
MISEHRWVNKREKHVLRCDQALDPLGSNRLQLNKGGGATPFLLRGLVDGDVNSIPTAPTKTY